jgi:phosphoglycerate dehydrogenase-like enzyme
MPRILLTANYSEEPMAILNETLPSGFTLITLENVTKDELLNKAVLADYILASGRLSIDKDIVDVATKLKMVQRTGVGLDTLDLDYLKEKKIPVYVNQGINSQSVAEHTLLLMLATLRRLPIIHGNMKVGIWDKQKQGVLTNSLHGKTIGLIGAGTIGKAVAQLLGNFNVNILYYDTIRLPRDREIELKMEFAPMNDLLLNADIVSLHCALNDQTLKLIGKDELSMMKKGSIIINTARGRLIDESALIPFLRCGHIKAAGLDVFEKEPISSDSELLKMDNVIVTPHIAGITHESFYEMMSASMFNIKMFEEGNWEIIEDRKIQ